MDLFCEWCAYGSYLSKLATATQYWLLAAGASLAQPLVPAWPGLNRLSYRADGTVLEISRSGAAISASMRLIIERLRALKATHTPLAEWTSDSAPIKSQGGFPAAGAGAAWPK